MTVTLQLLSLEKSGKIYLKVNFAFALFAVLLAGRDVVYDLFLSKQLNPLWFSGIICSVIAAIGVVQVAVCNRFQRIREKLSGSKFVMAALALGFACAAIYTAAFVLIGMIGAGLFNLFDYTFTPIFTVLFARWCFGERIPKKHIIVFVTLYVPALLMLAPFSEAKVWWAVPLALGIPILTSFSDAVSKALLTDSENPLGQHELLVVRFGPAGVILLVISGLRLPCPDIGGVGFAILTSIFLGYMPLLFLMYGLKRGALNRLAVWELTIPALAFVGTLPAYIETNATGVRVLGATGILFAAYLLIHSGARVDAGSQLRD